MTLRNIIAASALSLTIAGGYALNNFYLSDGVSDTNNEIPKTKIFMTPENYNYDQAWAEVAKLDNDRLPKKALSKVLEIRTHAKEEKNNIQLLRTYIHSIGYANAIKEDDNSGLAFQEELNELINETPSLNADAQAYAHYMVAQYYQAYLNENQWSIRNRTELENDTEADISKWSIARLNKEIDAQISASVADLKTSDVPIENFKDLIQTKYCADNLFPTLADFLVNDIMDKRLHKDIAQSDFSYRNLSLMASAEDFMNLSVQCEDTDATDFRRFALYQRWMRLHKDDKDQTAFNHINFSRLKFYHEQSVNEYADQQYQNALVDIKDQSSDNPEIYTQAAYLIAKMMSDQGKKAEAIRLADSVASVYPKASYATDCRYLVHNIKLKSLSFNCESYVSPSEGIPMLIEYTNLDKAYFHIFPITNLAAYNKEWQKLEYVTKHLKESSCQEWSLINDGDYMPKSSEIVLDKLPAGHYAIVASTSKNIKINETDVLSLCTIQVTSIAAVSQKLHEREYSLQILDRISGNPVPDCKVQVMDNKKSRQIYSAVTNNDGAILIDASKIDLENYWNQSIKISKGDDMMEFQDYLHNGYLGSGQQESSSVKIFTDRKIYRPGQTVYFKGIYYTKTSHSEAHVKAGSQISVRFKDPNHQTIEELKLTTNEYGSIFGEFKIPTNLVNGSFSIETMSGSERIRVEEYKRPTFEVFIHNITKEIRVGEDVEISGQALTYSGTKVSGAKAKYTVTRAPKWKGWWYWDFDRHEKTIEIGSVSTDDNGEFHFTFAAKPDPNSKESEYLSYRYNVHVDITDINGETRSASSTVSAGYRSMFLNIDLGSFVSGDREKIDSVNIYAENINGAYMPADIKVKVSSLAGFDKARLPKPWSSCRNPLTELTREKWDQMVSNRVFSDADTKLDSLAIDKVLKEFSVSTLRAKPIDLSFIQKSGHYLVELSCKDKDGNAVRYEQRFTYFDGKDINATQQAFRIFSDKSSYQPGDVATIYIASALSNARIFYQISVGNDIQERKMITVNHGIEKIKIPIKEEMRGGFSLKTYFVMGNNYKEENIQISVPFTNKILKTEFLTFRDMLYPGEKEKWRIRITDYLSNPAQAEMVATLYDESLDALMHHGWWFGIFGGRGSGAYFSHQFFGSGYSNSQSSNSNLAKSTNHYKRPPSANWYMLEPSSAVSKRARMREMTFAAQARSKNAVFDVMSIEDHSAPVMMRESVVEESAVAEMEEADAISNGAAEETQNFDNVEIRTNFNETAFFMPDIVTDKDGELYIEFTIPESITKWKMMGVAHTKDMQIGVSENHLVTRKDFSIQPNLPRFLRAGDEIAIPVKINNLTEDTDLSGQIKIEILSADNMEPVKEVKCRNAVQNFTVGKGKTIAQSFDIKVGEYMEPVIIKVMGASGHQGDGEQHILPILTDKQLVTEAITLSVRGNQTKKFEFTNWKNASKTAIDHSFTLEYSSNPAWYAVGSLPWLSENPYDCYEQIFSKLFANSISSLIIKENPEIEKTLGEWQRTNSQVLTSNLMKNQELKTVLIEETPWAIEGKDENERLSNLANLLNSERISSENAKLIKKMEKGQLSNGSWPWYDGMLPSPCITQHIVTEMGKLRSMGADISPLSNMIKKAMPYLDNEAAEHLKWMKRHKINEPGYYAFQYMYMRTFFPEYKMDRKAKEAYDYFLSYAKKNWTKFGIHYQALLCTTFKRTGDKALSNKIIESLKDRAIINEEMGMYFKENVNGFYFHEQNIETQAVIIEAFQEHGMNAEVEELKIWLIKNRQGNRWKTTKATTEACYAMFLCGNKISASEPLCEISVGKHQIDNSNAELGTGYIKQQWGKADMDISMADITVKNPNSHISYGAAYRQYFEKLENIKAAENKMRVEKKLFLQAKDAKGNDILREIDNKHAIHPGDKVTVRFIIQTDRDLEYVHLKDMRAAGFEPLNVISRTKYQDGMYYYESTKDASENFFIEHLNKGTYVFEYPLIAVHSGNFSGGIATIQCMYAPEFVSHSEGMRVSISE